MISITLWRAEIGQFYHRAYTSSTKIVSDFSFPFRFSCQKYTFISVLVLILQLLSCDIDLGFRIFLSVQKNFLYFIFISSINLSYFIRSHIDIHMLNERYYVYQVYIFLSIVLLRCGDIESNPGPRLNPNQGLSVCFWNLNSLSVNNFAKKDLLVAFNSIHNFDIICLAETYLDSSYPPEDIDLQIDNYTMLRADHPMDIKRGGVCVYHKNYLAVNVLNFNLLSECIIMEIEVDNKKIILFNLYRSPSQSPEVFAEFIENFENCLKNIYNSQPFMITVVGDFNAKSSNWCSSDISSNEGIHIDSVASYYGLHQLISDSTHILPNSSSCIDLIFTSQPNLVIQSGVFPSLHSNCHHNITYAKFDLFIEYPPPYSRLVWNYSKAEVPLIQESASNFDWVTKLSSLNIEEQIKFFNETLLNIFSNFCPHKTITCNDKDPPWLTDDIKRIIYFKDQAYRHYQRSNKTAQDYVILDNVSRHLNEQIELSKQEYYHKLSIQLNNPFTSRKKYWTLLKTLINGKKVPVIPPLLVNNIYISNINEKANEFNNFFSSQCSTIDTGSDIPDEFQPITNYELFDIDFTDQDIMDIISNLNLNKAHGYDNISIRILKIFGKSICKPLELIFRNCLAAGKFPLIWKKANVIPIHKKNEKNLLKNYRPISLLPVCSKIFERLIFNSMYNYICNNNLFSPNQSGFRAGDSCTNQLLSITHLINSSFDDYSSIEVRGVFLDMSKAFDKVWHDGLVYKLKTFGITGKLLSLLSDFLSNRCQRVALNGQYSEWKDVKAGVPQGSILGPLLFLIYINDLSVNLKSTVKLFADDVSLFSIVQDPNVSAAELNSDLRKINNWAYQWRMSFNPDPFKQATEVLFSKKRTIVNHPDLFFNGIKVNRDTSQKHLGMILDEKLTFNNHVSKKLSKASKGVGIIRKLFYLIPRNSLVTIYKSFIRPHLDYADFIYDKPNNDSFVQNIEAIQYNAALAITGAIKGTSKDRLYQELGLESLSARRWSRRLLTFHKYFTSKSPLYLYSIIPKVNFESRTRQRENIPLLKTRTDAFKYSYFPNSIQEWNKISVSTRNLPFTIFRNFLLKSIRPKPKLIFGLHNPKGLKHLTRLRLGLSHLREHKFKHNFQDSINPICSCGGDIETTEHFFLHCQNFSLFRVTLLNSLANIDSDLINMDSKELTNLLLYGSSKFDLAFNNKVLSCSIQFILSSDRFSANLYQ